MGFRIVIEGDTTDSATAEADEQALTDTVKDALSGHAGKLTVVTATLDFSGTRDLLAEINGGQGGGTGGGTSPTDPTTGFVWREAGETDYSQMEQRLFTFNQQAEQNGQPQVPQPYISHDDWNAISV